MPSPAQAKNHASADSAPLSTLLSQLLIAFTIEFDNEFEQQMPHRTTSFASATDRGPWLGSMVLWVNLLRLVPEGGITVGELRRQARTEMIQLQGMERWGHIIVTPNPGDS